MDEADQTAALLELIRQGDQQAAEALYASYAKRLTRLAEQRLSRKLAPRLDGEDVVQSVFRTFFRRTAQGCFHIDSSAQIWRLLVKITLLKARATGRYHTAEKRNVHAEVASRDPWLDNVLARGPGPEEVAYL